MPWCTDRLSAEHLGADRVMAVEVTCQPASQAGVCVCVYVCALTNLNYLSVCRLAKQGM